MDDIEHPDNFLEADTFEVSYPLQLNVEEYVNTLDRYEDTEKVLSYINALEKVITHFTYEGGSPASEFVDRYKNNGGKGVVVPVRREANINTEAPFGLVEHVKFEAYSILDEEDKRALGKTVTEVLEEKEEENEDLPEGDLTYDWNSETGQLDVGLKLGE